MKKTYFNLVITFVVCGILGCGSTNVSFLGLFNKKIDTRDESEEAKKESFTDADIDNGRALLSIRLLLGNPEDITTLKVYLTDKNDNKILPDSITDDIYYFTNIEQDDYTIFIDKAGSVVKKEKFSIYSGGFISHDIVFAPVESSVVIAKNLLTFDFENIPSKNENGQSFIVAQVFDGISHNSVDEVQLELTGINSYRLNSIEGGLIISENISPGEYEVRISDVKNKTNYTYNKGKLTILPNTVKDLNIYLFEGEYTDTMQYIMGELKDYTTGLSISGAKIEVLGSGQITYTNQQGEFVMKIGPGPAQMKIEKEGYIENCVRIIATPNTLLSQDFFLVKPAAGFSVGRKGILTTVSKDIDLNIPEGALKEEEQISFTVLPEGVYFTGFVSNSNIPPFHMEPSDLKFGNPITLRFGSLDVADYEQGEIVLVNVFSDGILSSEKKLEAKRDGDDMVITMAGINSSYLPSRYSYITPQSQSSILAGWQHVCTYTATIKAHEKILGSIRCYNNPFMPIPKTVNKFILASHCYGNPNVSCDNCAKKALQHGIPPGKAYACAKTLNCAAPNCHKSFLKAKIPQITFTGELQKQKIILPNGGVKWIWRVVNPPRPACYDWTPVWDNSQICCNGQICNKNMPNPDKCVEWYCENGTCKQRPTQVAKNLAKLCFSCDPQTGKKGQFLCDPVCEKCVEGDCKPLKFYHVKTTTVTTTEKHCPPASDVTNTTTTVDETAVNCPPPPLPANSTNTQIIPGIHDCEKTIITTVISWSLKVVTP